MRGRFRLAKAFERILWILSLSVEALKVRKVRNREREREE